MLEAFKSYIQQEALFERKDRLLLTVSGGVDSIVLCDLCSKAGYSFSIAHANFQLRAEESEADEQFVLQLGKSYGVPVFIKKFNTRDFAASQKKGIQETARDLRYEWFRDLLLEPQNDLRYIVTAHHANDNIETVLLNFLRGTGLNGLQGILPKQSNHPDWPVRPMLFANKASILQYAMENALNWREDKSNDSSDYSRNFIRNEILPVIAKGFPQAEENMMKNIDKFKQVNLVYRDAIDKIIKKLVVVNGQEHQFPVLKLKKQLAAETILFEMIKNYHFTSSQVPEIMKLLDRESGKYIDSDSHRIFRNRNWMVIVPLASADNRYYLIEENVREVSFGKGRLKIEHNETVQKIDPDPLLAQIDAAQLAFPLLLRKWKQGDYFYPLGMTKKKKLSRFFIDQKLSITQKQDAWVLESGKKIIWVLGMRIDNRFRITANTKQTVTLTLRPA